MPAYSLDLNGLDGIVYVPSLEFPEAVQPGDTFTLNDSTWKVTDVATKQFDAHDQPEQTLHCILA
jgi:sorbitol-specific phosphotransferase system component IIA